MRRILTFPCAGETLAATLDTAPAATGLLIVSGGRELRMGAHRGMALAAARVAAAGFPVFRFDRRGVGDSTGRDAGFASSEEDIAAAANAFRREAGVARIVAFGNCDAATALARFHAKAGIDALLLANPWVIEPAGNLPPPAAIRARYRTQIGSLAEWKRLLTGAIDLRRLARGLRTILGDRRQISPLAVQFATALDRSTTTRILLATGDNTAITFAAAWQHRRFAALRRQIALERHDTASHSFARDGDAAWLVNQMLTSLRTV
jgi:exosortase A-associated hydrolase 1